MTNKTFVFFEWYVRMDENPPFSEDTINREIEFVNDFADTISWTPNRLFSFDLVIPKTVYKPREDTNLLANRLIEIGNGRGRKFLEIGSGSGALSVLASSLGWKVFACDINPFAVSATIGNLELNKQSGTVLEGGVGPESFPFMDRFDLIVWNLPYISLDEQEQFLGPLEDAAMLDTDEIGLDTRFVNTIQCKDLLTKDGSALMLIDLKNLKPRYSLSHRIWDKLEFRDGETIGIVCLWHAYHDKETKFLEITTSTNDNLMDETDKTSGAEVSFIRKKLPAPKKIIEHIAAVPSHSFVLRTTFRASFEQILSTRPFSLVEIIGKDVPGVYSTPQRIRSFGFRLLPHSK